MSDEKLYTKRDLWTAKREGYMRRCQETGMTAPEASRCLSAAYPSPKRTTTRVVEDPHSPHIHWRVDRGLLYVMDAAGPGEPEYQLYPRRGEDLYTDAKRVALWAELLANPTEEVEG